MAAPKLRFEKYNEVWNSYKLIDIAKIYDGTHQTPNYVEQGVPFYSVEHVTANDFSNTKFIAEEVYQSELKRVSLQKGDILMTRIGDIGTSRLIDWDVRASFYVSLALIKVTGKNNSVFINQYIKSRQFQKELHDRTIHVAFPKKINLGEIGLCKIQLPEIEEQTKIASFLSAVDEKISQLTQKHELLSQYKQGMMQKLFSQQIRFKVDDGSEFGEWEEKPLNEIASKQPNKNKDDSITEVLTNSATQGIIKQSDYFDREIVTESNLNGYYIVNLNDFVYNPRISVHAPVGPIKRNKKCLGVMSPLYTVFTVKEGDLTYLEYFFDSNFWHDYVKSVANSGARHDRMNITNKDFFDMPIIYPCREEQTKIANFLSSIDQKIEVVTQQIEQAKMWKKGLLQQMFV
ncbi:restriction endonuclease subunit S [Acinetobacter junii]